MLKESIELHEKAIKELYVTFYPSLEYLGYENDFYKEICLDDIKSLHETFINIFLKYDLDAQFII